MSARAVSSGLSAGGVTCFILHEQIMATRHDYLVTMICLLRRFLQNPIPVFDVSLTDANIFGELSELDEYVSPVLIFVIQHPVPVS